MPLDDLYRELIMDHSQHPRHKGSLEDPTFEVGLNNPTCGDEIVLYVELHDGRVTEARFEGAGCSISMAAASMLTEAIRGMEVPDLAALTDSYKAMLRGEDGGIAELGELTALQGVKRFPMRVKCAALAVNALEKGLSQLKEDDAHGQE